MSSEESNVKSIFPKLWLDKEINPLKFFTFEKKFSNLSVAVSPGEDCPHEKRIATTGGF